jgi:hypothetical protein
MFGVHTPLQSGSFARSAQSFGWGGALRVELAAEAVAVAVAVAIRVIARAALKSAPARSRIL